MRTRLFPSRSTRSGHSLTNGRRWPRLVVAALAAVLIVMGGGATPALAAPDDIFLGSIQGDDGAGDALAETYVCQLFANPVPQYSTAGGTYGTVHWGGRIACTGTPAVTLYLKMDLMQLVGTGENAHPEQQETHTKNSSGMALAGSWYTGCFNNASYKWQIRGWAKRNGTAFVPYPGLSAWYTLPCS